MHHGLVWLLVRLMSKSDLISIVLAIMESNMNRIVLAIMESDMNIKLAFQ